MSVQLNHYVMVGAKYDYRDFYEKFVSSDYEKVIEDWIDDVEYEYCDSALEGIKGKNNITIISDGMNAEYVYIGCVIYKSSDHGFLDDFKRPGNTPTSAEVELLITKEFNVEVKCQLFAFSHHS